MTAVARNDEVDSTTDVTTAPHDTVEPAVDTSIDGLVRAHLPLVGHLVRELLGRVPSHVNRDDLTSAGMLALAMAAKSFDVTRGVPFGRFAAIRIRGALTDELRTMDWASRAVRGKAREVEATRTQLTAMLGRAPRREEVAQAMGVTVREVDGVDADVQRASVLSLQGLTPDEGAELLPTANDGPEALLIKREQLGYLRDAVAELPDRLRTVVAQYFFEQRKMADIAIELGVTESRVSQLRSEALAMLREGMQATEGAPAQEPPAVPALAESRRRANAREAYRTAVATRSTVAGRLAASTLLAEPRPHLVMAAN
jgi:RNA polymerase sigma factor for flagellar operon FliA